MLSDYFEVRNWLEGFIPQVWTKKELRLERIRYFLKLLGNPQNKFKSIHIAGTSGKGSTAFYLARLLRESKSQRVKVGLHVSPHLSYIGERMQIFQAQSSKLKAQKYRNNEVIPMDKFIKLMNEMKPYVESMKDSKVGSPSYFEILVAASFKYFTDEKVDLAVVETGLGGRLDATNMLRPKISVITNIGLDHTDILGRSIEKVALEKAGIIKENIPIITGVRGKTLEVIRKVAENKKASLITIDTQMGIEPLKSNIFNNINIPIDILRSYSEIFAFQSKLLALLTFDVLNLQIDKSGVIKALNGTFPGRFEEIDKNVILDGAHNIDKIQYLVRYIKKFQTSKSKIKIILVVAFKKGRNWRRMIDLLLRKLPVWKVITTKFYAATDMGKYATVDPGEIATYVKRQGFSLHGVYSNSQKAVFEAMNETKSIKQETRNLVLVTGSLYLVGEARTMWYLSEF